MLAVCLGLCSFLPDLRGHHVLVRSDSMTVVSYINSQGGLSSKRLFILVESLLEWLSSTCVHWKQRMCWAGWTRDQTCYLKSPLGQVDAPPTNGSQNLGDLRQGRGRPLRLKRIVWFFKESRRLNPPRPITVPLWHLPTVLRALKSPPFEPLKSVDLHPLTLKTALLLALASVKHMGDLQVLSVSPTCLEFDPGNSKVILKPRHGYLPKVEVTWASYGEMPLI